MASGSALALGSGFGTARALVTRRAAAVMSVANFIVKVGRSELELQRLVDMDLCDNEVVERCGEEAFTMREPEGALYSWLQRLGMYLPWGSTQLLVRHSYHMNVMLKLHWERLRRTATSVVATHVPGPALPSEPTMPASITRSQGKPLCPESWPVKTPTNDKAYSRAG